MKAGNWSVGDWQGGGLDFVVGEPAVLWEGVRGEGSRRLGADNHHFP